MNQQEKGQTILIEYQCFGNISFWTELVSAKSVCFEHFERFQKTGFRNRHQVLGSNGVITLTVPVQGGRETRQLTSEVLIDNSVSWQSQHWKTIQSCYNKSPFFFHYEMGLSALYQKSFTGLVEFNLAAFHWVANALRLQVKMTQTQAFIKTIDKEGFKDLRSVYKTGTRLTTPQKRYLQVFGEQFEKNLGICDLIFNLGPESMSYLIDNNAI